MGILNFETGKFSESEYQPPDSTQYQEPDNAQYQAPDNTEVKEFVEIDEFDQKTPGNIMPKGLLVVLIIIAVCAGAYHFWPSNNAQAVTEHMALTGILYSDHNPAAVVDTQIVHEGEMIKGVKVVKIYPDKVMFEKNGQTWTQGSQKSGSGSGTGNE
ncbi:MAG: hypothetical protein ACYTBV_01785 [Planctomycetota bacterium]|jgi:type II secretory pathway component PulC